MLLLPAGAEAAPTASPASLSTELNTPKTLPLSITPSPGQVVTGVSISSAPAHGTVDVDGTLVTYTPNPNFFGADRFFYLAFETGGGVSSSALVSVVVNGRPDLSQDSQVNGLILSQYEASKRFAKAQIANFQRRLESLHRYTGDETDVHADADVPGSGHFNGLIDNPVDGSSRKAFGLLEGNEFWVAGNARFGTDKSHPDSTLDFSTDGITLGVDRRIHPQWAVGVGFGLARDHTDVGNDGTRSKSGAISAGVYSSFQPTPSTFVDGLIGYEALDFETDRFVAPINDLARGRRDGNQLFTSLSTGYEYRNHGLLLSPYSRIDYAVTRLEKSTETGVGQFAITYAGQTTEFAELTVGLRAELLHAAKFGWIIPRARVEFQHDPLGNGLARIDYADPSGTGFNLTPQTANDTAWLFGVGSRFLLRNGLSLDLEYQTRNTFGNLQKDQFFQAVLIKDLDGNTSRPSGEEFFLGSYGHNIWTDKLQASVVATWDNNVNRAETSRDGQRDRKTDQFYSLNISKGFEFKVADHVRLLMKGIFNGEKFQNHTGLGRVSGGAQAELQYRYSGSFIAPTFGIFGRITGDEYESRLRDGFRYSGGVTYRQPITDRIALFGEAAYNGRDADSDVFDVHDTSVRLNLDYRIIADSNLYVSGEYRSGDVVSTASSTLAAIDVAEVLVQDDVFQNFFDYRFEGETAVLTVGYNLPLGASDSLDISCRQTWAQSFDRPQLDPPFNSRLQYNDTQVSASYSLRF